MSPSASPSGTASPSASPSPSPSPRSKVGSRAAPLTVQKLINGQDADTTPGYGVAPGGYLSIEVLVQNTGTEPLTDIQVQDSTGVTLDCLPQVTTLQAGASLTCWGTTTAPTTMGAVHHDTATASALAGQTRVTASDEAYATVTPVQISKFVTLHETPASFNRVLDPGDVLSYYIHVDASAGGITDLSVSDPSLANLQCTEDPAGFLYCTGERVITQADLDSCQPVRNTATVTYTTDGQTTPTTLDSTVDAFLGCQTITKTHSQFSDTNDNGFTDAGDTVTYQIDATLQSAWRGQTTNIEITDPAVPGLTCSYTDPENGETVTGFPEFVSDAPVDIHCTGIRTLTAGDVSDTCEITNTATLAFTQTVIIDSVVGPGAEPGQPTRTKSATDTFTGICRESPSPTAGPSQSTTEPTPAAPHPPEPRDPGIILPQTGAPDVMWMALLGAALVAGGLILVARRKR